MTYGTDLDIMWSTRHGDRCRDRCRCLNSLEMKQRSDYEYPATAPSKGSAFLFPPSFTPRTIYLASPANRGAKFSFAAHSSPLVDS